MGNAHEEMVERETMEKIERKVFEFLYERMGEKFNVVQIAKNIKHGYPAVLKYVMILGAKGLIEVEDYGNVKQVSFAGGNFDDDE